MPAKTVRFETKLNSLEKLVEEMERGDLELEDALKHFEKGIALVRECQHVLEKAEQKVDILMSATPEAKPEPFQSQ